jgi:polyisoprenoid-binding protein YceI
MRCLAVALLGGLAGPASAEPVTYVFNPDHTFVQFEVLHFGTSTLRGRFGPLRGAVTLDRAAGSGEIGIRLSTASVDTGLRVLDARLRQPDLLASEAFPEAFFVARQFRFEGDRVAELRGEFTLRGSSQGVTLKALHFACRQDGDNEVCGGDFEGRFKRSDFGITYGLPLVADEVQLRVAVEGTRQPPRDTTAPQPPVIHSAVTALKKR